NVVHATINSLMGTFASPGDPFFFIHHSTVDALHAIYDKCVVKPKGTNTDPKNRLQWPNPAEWRTTPFNPQDYTKRCWKSVSRSPTGYTYTDWAPNDDVLMRVMVNDKTYSRYVDVLDKDSPLRPYFAAITDAKGTILHTYQDFFDTNVGVASYNYNLGDKAYGLGRLNDQCRDMIKSTVSVNLMEGAANPSDAAERKQQLFQHDMYLFFKSQGVPEAEIVGKISLARCVYTNECLGGVYDYTDDFRKNFQVSGSPKCFTDIHRFARGEIALPNGWLRRFEQHYPCHSSAIA
ncbi:hypothetical protein As57867_003392, partial [Aphanomyces stellatus]